MEKKIKILSTIMMETRKTREEEEKTNDQGFGYRRRLEGRAGALAFDGSKIEGREIYGAFEAL